jgi:hypothetical protein
MEAGAERQFSLSCGQQVHACGVAWSMKQQLGLGVGQVSDAACPCVQVQWLASPSQRHGSSAALPAWGAMPEAIAASVSSLTRQ